VEYHSTFKKKEISLFATTWMSVENNVIREAKD
jgi:hypothetical protein